MILGLNTDVRHKGKTFHIQTEDSGVTNPVLITHVFIGGTIIATRKSSYDDALKRDDLEKHVRRLMRAQHRAAHEAVSEGEFDEVARTARAKKSVSDIPLAKKRGPVGVMSGRPEPRTVTAPPPEESIEELDAADLEPVKEPAAVKRAPTTPPPPPAGSIRTPAPAEELVPDQTANGFVEYPTDLISGRPLDPVLVAWLLEDEQPT